MSNTEEKPTKTVLTEERSDLVAISDEPIVVDKDARILALEEEVEELNDELAKLTRASDQEIMDHGETARSRDAIERHLVHMFNLWSEELNLGIDELNGADEAELKAAILTAQERIAAGEAREAAKAAAATTA